MSHTLDRLCEVIRQRRQERPSNSYVVSLLDGGRAATDAKVIEEAAELVAAKAPAEIVHEAADLIFHTLVLLESADVAADEVWTELERRFGMSGLEEKAARGTK